MSTYDSNQLNDERRSFASRTPTNDSPDQIEYRRGFVTRHQVSGWRFVMRRIASGMALHDTRMLVDPLRSQARSVLMGLLALATIAGGCYVFTLIWPNTVASNDVVLTDRDTAALYVKIGDKLHPALNLTSARLVAGQPVDPVAVRSSVLDTFTRGNLVGIPGAPERMVQSSDRDAQWTVCDATQGSEAGTTIITGAIDSEGTHAKPLDINKAILASSNGESWLLFQGKRSRIDITDNAITDALGIRSPEHALPNLQPISDGFFNTIPEAPPLVAPVVPQAGDKPDFDLPLSLPVGAVVGVHVLEGSANPVGTHYLAVLPDGVQPISGVLAALLRNIDSYGLDQPPYLAADVVSRLPVSHMLDTTRYPEQPVNVIDTTVSPVMCVEWNKQLGATTATITLLSGSTLPLTANSHTLELVGANKGDTATQVVVSPGYGYLVRSVASQAGSTGSDNKFWISDMGVRYPIANEPDPDLNTIDPITALGINNELTLDIPAAVLRQFAPGPTLSRKDALLAHDALTPNNQAVSRININQLNVASTGGEAR